MDTSQGFLFDWIQYTFHGATQVEEEALCSSIAAEIEKDFEHALRDFLPVTVLGALEGLSLNKTSGTNGYQLMYHDSHGFSIQFGSYGNALQGICVTIPGHFLAQHFPSEGEHLLLAQWLRERYDWCSERSLIFKASRLDIKIDISTPFSKFYDAYINKQYKGIWKRTKKIVDGREIIKEPCRICADSDSTGTLYFGHLDSRKMIRIYDKIKERTDSLRDESLKDFVHELNEKNIEHCTRIEMVFREDQQHPCGREALENMRLGTMKLLLFDMLQFGEYRRNKGETYAKFYIADWYEQSVNFVQSEYDLVKLPYVENHNISINWLKYQFIPMVNALRAADPVLFDLLLFECSASEKFYNKVQSELPFIYERMNFSQSDIESYLEGGRAHESLQVYNQRYSEGTDEG